MIFAVFSSPERGSRKAFALPLVVAASFPKCKRGWSSGAMVLGKLPVPGRPTFWITLGQGPTAFEVGARGGCLDNFILIYPFSPLSSSL